MISRNDEIFYGTFKLFLTYCLIIKFEKKNSVLGGTFSLYNILSGWDIYMNNRKTLWGKQTEALDYSHTSVNKQKYFYMSTESKSYK